MAIDAIENNTRVLLPCGREGRTRVTRRERKLIAEGCEFDIDVLCSDGLVRRYRLAEISEVVAQNALRTGRGYSYDVPAWVTEEAEQMRQDFNDAIDFAILDDEPAAFLTAWREGDWEGLRKEWPEFEISEVLDNASEN